MEGEARLFRHVGLVVDGHAGIHRDDIQQIGVRHESLRKAHRDGVAVANGDK